MISIALRKEILSRNKLDSMHWAKRSRQSKDWESEIFAALLGKIKKASGKMSLKVLSLRARKLDHDNLVGGGKPILDALKRLGLILNDSPNWVEVIYEQKIQKPCATFIDIKEA